jgi:predicted nucleic acid-binding protein
VIRYLDTSAALKLVVEERESSVLAADLTRAAAEGDTLLASMLLYTELHCAAQRHDEMDSAAVNAVLDGITLVDLERGDLERAATSAWGLRSADAIHLAVALRLQADEVVGYDGELLRAAQRAGIPVSSPGTG